MLVRVTSVAQAEPAHVQLSCPAGRFGAQWHGSEAPAVGAEYHVELSCPSDLTWLDDGTLVADGTGSGALGGKVLALEGERDLVVSIVGTPTMLTMAPGEPAAALGATVMLQGLPWSVHPHDRAQPQPRREAPAVPPTPGPNLLLTVAQVLGVIVVYGLAVTAGLPSAPATIFVAGVGAAIILRHRARRQLAVVSERHPQSAAYPLLIPCERTAVGSLWVTRLAGGSARVWAPGVLGVDRGRVEFFPNRPRHDPRAWTAGGATAEVFGPGWHRACALRVHGPDGAAQFVVQQPAAEVRRLVTPYLPEVQPA